MGLYLSGTRTLCTSRYLESGNHYETNVTPKSRYVPNPNAGVTHDGSVFGITIPHTNIDGSVNYLFGSYDYA